GIPKMQTVSASQRTHLAELLMLAIETDRPKSQEEPVAKYPRIALVGKPNVGKSSLLNILLGEERSIVSPIAGTTRDSVDVTVEIDGEKYTLVDTAGIRRKQSEKEVVDKFAFIRTKEAIESADLCLLMLDANDGLHVQDKKIANLIEEYGKGCILLLNKWDLVKGFRMEHCLKTIHEENPFLAHCPALCLSAKEGRNVDKIFPVVNRVLEPTREKISTHALNKFFEQQLQKLHPPVIGGRRLRIYYATQGGMTPPTFLLFVNSPHLMQESYKRYLVREMRRTFGFEGLPVKLILKGKKKKVEDE
ncbi:MAG: ribosome biogenesis GTPase Der, partial [Chlamydiia bacterium]|nr:ribosome biogenesis GTPase Der [Chlamydiia bacterium]